MIQTTGYIDLNIPGTHITLPIAGDEFYGIASLEVIDAANTPLDGGTLKITASADGFRFSETLWTFTTASALARFDVRGYSFIRAEVGTAASGRVICSVTLRTSQTG